MTYKLHVVLCVLKCFTTLITILYHTEPLTVYLYGKLHTHTHTEFQDKKCSVWKRAKMHETEHVCKIIILSVTHLFVVLQNFLGHTTHHWPGVC